jgi:excisionase family DNA binding protein
MSGTIELLTIDEVSERLHISKSWIYSELALRRFPSVKLGRALRFRAIDIDDYLQRRRDSGDGVSVPRPRRRGR